MASEYPIQHRQVATPGPYGEVYPATRFAGPISASPGQLITAENLTPIGWAEAQKLKGQEAVAVDYARRGGESFLTRLMGGLGFYRGRVNANPGDIVNFMGADRTVSPNTNFYGSKFDLPPGTRNFGSIMAPVFELTDTTRQDNLFMDNIIVTLEGLTHPHVRFDEPQMCVAFHFPTDGGCRGDNGRPSWGQLYGRIPVGSAFDLYVAGVLVARTVPRILENVFSPGGGFYNAIAGESGWRTPSRPLVGIRQPQRVYFCDIGESGLASKPYTGLADTAGRDILGNVLQNMRAGEATRSSPLTSLPINPALQLPPPQWRWG